VGAIPEQAEEQALGPEHVELAYPLTNLASLYFEQGKYQQAEPLYQRAVRIFEQELGLEHVMVAYPLNGLADLYTEQEHYDQVELCYERADERGGTRSNRAGGLQPHREDAGSDLHLCRV
jgi:tetratricopeptide (TPR) repeat protein